MTEKDEQLIDHIIKHYNELLDEIAEINDDYETFDENTIYQKAIKMDLFQIGELFNSLSGSVTCHFDNRDVRGIVDIRNYIAHGYIVLDNKNIWRVIHNDLPKLSSGLKLLFE